MNTGSNIKQKNGPQPANAHVSPRRVFPLVLLLVLVALAVGEIAATLLQHHAAPQEKDWQAAAEKLRQVRQGGEPVLFAPLWIEPLGRQYLGDQLDLELLLLSDVDQYPRVWEISTRGTHHPWLQNARQTSQFHFGAVTVSLFEKAAAEVLFDFTRHIKDAKVQCIGDRSINCHWQRKRFVCDPQQPWNWVGPHLAEVGHRPYRCIYAHPVPGHLMRIQFTDVPLGNTLVGYTGIDDFEHRKMFQGPVALDIKIDDQLLGTIQHQNQWPWHRFTIDTTAFAGQKREVRFEVAAENTYARTFCFSVEARR